jgi:hypothetical protein
MATIDASIPLQAQQPKDPLQSYAETLQLAQGIQNFQGQQALRDAFANSDTSTPEGQQALIKRVGSVNPSEAMTLQQQFGKQRETESTIAKNKAQTAKANWEVGAQAMAKISEVGSAAMMTYADLVHKGVPDAQARQIVSQAIPQIKAHLKSLKDPQGNPLFHAEQVDQIPDQFDPQATMATVTDAKARAEYYTQQHQNETLEQQKKHQAVEERQGAQRIGIEGARLSNEERHQGVMESQGAERLGIERERVQGDPATIERNADLIGTGKMAPPTGAALRNPVMAATMARVQEKYPNFDAKTYQTELTGEKQFTSGKLGNTVRSLNVATDHLDALDQMGKALGNGDVQAFNRLAQSIAAQTGSPAPTNFDAAKKIVADEVVKAVVGSGGGVSDREEAAKAFDKVSSPAQLSGAIATAKRLMRGQLNGLKQQYKSSTGKEDFDERFLSGEAKSIENGKPAAGKQAGGNIHWNDLK